eukprot:Rmarinus@m.18262
MTVFYDQSNPFGTLFSWRGTAFKLIFQENREVYIYFSAHIIISVIHNFYMDLGGDYSSDLLDSLETSGFFSYLFVSVLQWTLLSAVPPFCKAGMASLVSEH